VGRWGGSCAQLRAERAKKGESAVVVERDRDRTQENSEGRELRQKLVNKLRGRRGRGGKKGSSVGTLTTFAYLKVKKTGFKKYTGYFAERKDLGGKRTFRIRSLQGLP